MVVQRRRLSLLVVLWTLLMTSVGCFSASSGSSRRGRPNGRLLSSILTFSSSEGGANAASADKAKPILVVGATGRVGRRVVQRLLGEGRPVRALVRNPDKAKEIFGTATKLEYPPLEIFVADLGDYERYENVLDKAVSGCDCIISMMGVVRFAKLSDFLPWRLFNWDVSSWAGRDHPFYGNYLGQKKLIELAERHKIKRFVRLTGLGLANSPFNPFSILFNTLLSFNNRYGSLCEQALAASKVPYVVLRPGGLAEDARDTNTTNIQVEASGVLPFPGRIGRSDVAALALAACNLPQDKNFILACRWCGDNIKPQPQGKKSDGQATADECIRHLIDTKATSPLPSPKLKPYAFPVAVVVYSSLALALKLVWSLWNLALTLLHG